MSEVRTSTPVGPDGLEAQHVERCMFDPAIDAIAAWWKRFREDFLEDHDVPSAAIDDSSRLVDPTSEAECAMQSAAMRAKVRSSLGSPDEPLVPWWAKGVIETEKNQI